MEKGTRTRVESNHSSTLNLNSWINNLNMLIKTIKESVALRNKVQGEDLLWNLTYWALRKTQKHFITVLK